MVSGRRQALRPKARMNDRAQVSSQAAGMQPTSLSRRAVSAHTTSRAAPTAVSNCSMPSGENAVMEAPMAFSEAPAGASSVGGNVPTLPSRSTSERWNCAGLRRRSCPAAGAPGSV